MSCRHSSCHEYCRNTAAGCSIGMSAAPACSNWEPRHSVMPVCPVSAQSGVLPSATMQRGCTSTISASSSASPSMMGGAYHIPDRSAHPSGSSFFVFFAGRSHSPITLSGGRCLHTFVMNTSSRRMPPARSHEFSSRPAAPMNGSPCSSSSAPGASPTIMSAALRGPTAGTLRGISYPCTGGLSFLLWRVRTRCA